MAAGSFVSLLFFIIIFVNLKTSKTEVFIHNCELQPKIKSGEDAISATELILTSCPLEDLNQFKNLQILRIHYFNGKLEFDSIFENLATLEIHSGHFQINPDFSKKLPNLKTFSLEDVDIPVIQSGTFSQFRFLEEISIRHSNISQIESSGIDVKMDENSQFLIVNSQLKHVFKDGIRISQLAAAKLEENSVNFAEIHSFRIQADNIVFKSNRIEHGAENAFVFESPKIAIDDNIWITTNPQILTSVALQTQSLSYFSLINNTFGSRTSIDVNFRQLNTFNSTHLERILIIRNNTLPCSCNFPLGVDGESKFVEHSRTIYYNKLLTTSVCLNGEHSLLDFIQNECRKKEVINYPGIGTVVDRIVHPDEIYTSGIEEDTIQTNPTTKPFRIPQLTTEGIGSESEAKLHPVARKPANSMETKNGSEFTTLASSSSSSKSSTIGPVVIVVIAILLLIAVLVFFVLRQKFFS